MFTKRELELIASSLHGIHSEDGTDKTLREHNLSEKALALSQNATPMTLRDALHDYATSLVVRAINEELIQRWQIWKSLEEKREQVLARAMELYQEDYSVDAEVTTDFFNGVVHAIMEEIANQLIK